MQKKGVITAGNQLILGGCAASHEYSESRYTERTTGRCLQACCWTGFCGVSVCAWMRGAKAPRDDVTMWRYRVDVAPNLPKSPTSIRCYTELISVRYRYRCCTDTGTGSCTDVNTGMDVVPNLTNCPVRY